MNTVPQYGGFTISRREGERVQIGDIIITVDVIAGREVRLKWHEGNMVLPVGTSVGIADGIVVSVNEVRKRKVILFVSAPKELRISRLEAL